MRPYANITQSVTVVAAYLSKSKTLCCPNFLVDICQGTVWCFFIYDPVKWVIAVATSWEFGPDFLTLTKSTVCCWLPKTAKQFGVVSPRFGFPSKKCPQFSPISTTVCNSPQPHNIKEPHYNVLLLWILLIGFKIKANNLSTWQLLCLFLWDFFVAETEMRLWLPFKFHQREEKSGA